MDPIRIAWVPPHGTIDRASFRLECWYPHLWLSKHGFQSTVLGEFPTTADRGEYDFLIWFRTDHPERAFDSGIPVIYFLSDGPLPSDEYLDKARHLVTDCDAVFYQLDGGRATHIPDTFDPPGEEEMSRLRMARPRRHRNKLVWLGSQGGYPWAAHTIEHLRHNWEVEVISDHAEATKPWSRETVFRDVMDCDVGIVPYPEGLVFPVESRGFNPLTKDINRVVLLQAAGLPVIAAPLPAYKSYIRHGVDGLIADGPLEFEACAALLQEFPDAAEQMAKAGMMRAWATASSPFTGSRWARLLRRLVDA